MPDSTRDDLSVAERERLRHIIRTYHGESALLELDDLELDKALRLVTQIGEGYIPTVTGMLLIGRAERLKELIPTAESSIQIMDNAQLRVNETFTLPLLASIEKLIRTFFLLTRKMKLMLAYSVFPFHIMLLRHFVKRSSMRIVIGTIPCWDVSVFLLNAMA